jgi:hypothetical protein
MEDASNLSADRKRPFGAIAVGICLILSANCALRTGNLLSWPDKMQCKCSNSMT